MSKTPFDKYPKVASTKHCPLPSGLLTMQEKLDGANAGIQLDPEHPGCVLIHSRTRALFRQHVNGGEQLVDDVGSFGGLLEYIAPRLPKILAFMQSRDVAHIYGEWLVRHTLNYPEDMWRKFYVFDLMNTDGIYLDPEDYARHLNACDLPRVRAMYLAPEQTDALPLIQELAGEWNQERRMEGVVVKAYKRDAARELDEWGQRYAYKYVFPEFKEQHAGNPMFPPPASALTIEQRLAATMPDRSIEKVFQKVVDARGSWKPQHFPLLLGMIWQEFLEEHAVSAFQAHSLPVVNIRALKTEVERRAREFALAQPA